MSGSKTDDDILANVPGLDDEGDNGQDTSGDQQDNASGFQTDSSSDQRREQQGNREQQQTDDNGRIVKRTDGLVERQSAADPRRRDLVDPVTGQVVAQGGIERRIYEQSKRHERDVTTLRRENEQLKAQANGYQQANSLATQLGLSAEAQSTALRVMSDFTKDPVRTIEYLIAEVKGKGYNIPSLNGQGQATDLEAFAKLMDSRLAPIMQERQQSQQVQQANVRAKAELDNFLDQAPDARANLDILAEMLNGDQALNLNSAYIRFLTWCSANQLDPTQHVGPQLQARQEQAQTPPATQPRQARPVPGNRNMNGNSAIPVGSRAVHDENSEWSNIINDSMLEAGYNR
jgi:hypothetical protein